ncbi:MAG: MFS transporter [Corynebacterium sp.]|uniref:MFS transporter n=1 Tax=Corynebacterium sp. TaxID=1720 RepID=UPI0026DD5AE0|nr:MFS transporter [Corynebacterium sp.]MDO5097557.1 MFS transporter [Corynebacterium sp.]
MRSQRALFVQPNRTIGVFKLAKPSNWPNGEASHFAVTNLLASTSAGLVIATMVLFFNTNHGFDIASLTRAASIGSFTGLAAIPIIGRLARIFSSQTVYTYALLIQSIVLIGWQLTFGMVIGTSVIIAFSLCTAAIGATVGGLIAEMEIPTGALATTRAALRTISNIGIGLGGLLAALFLKISSYGARASILLASFFTFLAFLSMIRQLVRASRSRSRTTLSDLSGKTHVRKSITSNNANPYRDARYVGLFVTNGLLSTHTDVLTYVIPAVVLLKFSDKMSLVGLAAAINACIVILFQLRNTERAAKLSPTVVTTVATMATVTMTVLLAGSSHFGELLALVCLLGSVIALTVGELWQSSAEFHISYAAAPENNHQEYQAAYAFGRTLARSIAPVCLGWIVTFGHSGWLLLGTVYLVAGIVQITLASNMESKTS